MVCRGARAGTSVSSWRLSAAVPQEAEGAEQGGAEQREHARLGNPALDGVQALVVRGGVVDQGVQAVGEGGGGRCAAISPPKSVT